MIQNDIVRELENLPESELQSILNLIKAKKDTYHRPLAFVQELMGFKALQREENVFRYSMKVTDDLINRYGLLHGGLITAFIDTGMAETAFQIDNTIERALTLNIVVDFIQPGHPGDTLESEIRVIQNSHSIIVFQSSVTNPNGEIVATAMAHFYKQHKRKTD